jgi:soluble lytic murein transglycosylase-like protein
MIQGRALWYSDQREKAIELFRKVASDKRAPDGLRRDVVKRLGQIYRDVGRYEEGEKFLHAYAEAEPDRRLGAWASYQAAWMAMYQENYRRAIRLFKEYLKVYPDVPKRQIWRVRWYQAWCLFQLGSYREAIVQFRQLKRRVHRAQDGRRCEYWEARAYERMGDWGQAQRIYAGLARKSQMSYYGILAQQRLYLLGVQIAQQRCDGSCLAQSLRTKADQWLDSGFGKSRNHQFAGVSAEWRELIEKSFAHNSSNQTNDQEMEATALKATQYAVQPVQFPPLPSACKSSKWSACKALRRAQFLAVLGFERDAIDELYRGRYALRRSTAHLLAAIRWLRSKNAHHEAVQLSFYLRGTDSKMGLFYRDLLELSYPPAFAELVLRYAREFGISPALVWAVMREESLYAPFARSRVGALGLMQIIYPTGKRIAQQLKVDNFRFKSLYEIPVSIRKGSWYLAQLVRKYDGHILLAAAAYNAGPHRITVWLKNRNHLDLDAFIEEIYFEETRNYVKRIFRSYTAYSFLYRRRLPSTPPAVAVTVQNNIDF